jgi:type VI secretion system protein ImpK
MTTAQPVTQPTRSLTDAAALSDARPVQRKRRASRPKQPAGMQQLETSDRALHDAVRPLLVELSYLRQRDQLPPADVLFEHARRELNKLRVRLEELGLGPSDVEHIYYALVAFVDETMQADRGPLKDFWQAHLLQLELFGETRAGEGFYERLSTLCAERRLSALRVYYLCLLFGFQGIYAHHGALERENLIESVRETLGIALEDRAPLSPAGSRPDEPATDRRHKRLMQWIAYSTAAIALLWYLGVAFSLDDRARSLAAALARAASELESTSLNTAR